jgi:hypothetical protein
VAKKHLIETVLPIVLSLKGTLERLHSPMTQYVMIFLREVMKDYKEEMDGTIGDTSYFRWRKYE